MSKPININRNRIEIIDELCDETDYADVRTSIEDSFDAGVRWARMHVNEEVMMAREASSLKCGDARTNVIEINTIADIQSRLSKLCPLCLGDAVRCRNNLVKLAATNPRTNCNRCMYDCCVTCHTAENEAVSP